MDEIELMQLKESIEAMGYDFKEFIERTKKLAKKIGEILAEVVEKIREILQDLKYQNKPKYKFVKSLVKPYRQPFIKIKARSRANL